MSRNGSRGFTLIELLITLVVIGIIAAIALPYLMTALDKGRQKRTMADLRSIGTAVEAYAIDNNRYPVASDASTLALVLSASSSNFVRMMPQHDGWDHLYV